MRAGLKDLWHGSPYQASVCVCLCAASVCVCVF